MGNCVRWAETLSSAALSMLSCAPTRRRCRREPIASVPNAQPANRSSDRPDRRADRPFRIARDARARPPKRSGLRCHYQLIEVAGADRDRAARAARRRAAPRLCRRQRDLSLQGGGGRTARRTRRRAPPRCGAVNTVVVRDGRLIGHNTDTTGFARAVARLWSPAPAQAGRRDRRRRRRQGDRLCAGGLGVAELRIFDTERAKAEQLATLLQRPQGHGRRRQRRGRAAGRGRPRQRHAGRHAAEPQHAGAGCAAACGAVGRRCGLFAAVDAAVDWRPRRRARGS